jgi:hypothetical protein
LGPPAKRERSERFGGDVPSYDDRTAADHDDRDDPDPDDAHGERVLGLW